MKRMLTPILAVMIVLTLPTWGQRADMARGQMPDMGRWAAAAFSGAALGPAASEPALSVRRQDHGRLHLNRSVMDTPLRIGGRGFERGLGTHANSEIVVRLPAEAKALRALAGVDDNWDTHGGFGSVLFSVEIDGKEAFRSQVLRGGEEAAAVEVPIPAGARELVLRTDQTADGPGHDHADWAEARIVMKDGSDMWLDQLLPAVPRDLLPTNHPPFSFVYDGQPSAALLGTWTRTAETKDAPDRSEQVVRWTDPKTGLKLTATVTKFRDFPAVEWLLRFENGGKTDSPLLENVQALDLKLGTGTEPVVLDQIAGDDCTERSFMPVEQALKAGAAVRFAPAEGRPSCGAFPFFNVQVGRYGIIAAIGWTGRWAAAVESNQSGVTRVQAGMELTHLRLHPGEAIRTPRILLLAWSGERIEAHNQFRRLLLAHYLPKVDGQPARPAIGAQSFNMNAGGRRPEWNTEAGQIAAAKIERDLGCDTHWLDAAWFEGGFPNGVGNWVVRKQEYPRGLKPIGDACDKLGLKFLIWWEPERVSPGTRIMEEHPDWVLKDPGGGSGLFNLGDPAARRWMTDLLLKQIDEFGVRTYRNDFNIDPLPFWRKNDPPDRQGVSEIRYVEGFYEMWDAIRARHPGMVMDDCASGGRRIDLEMCMRSIVQTRSDTGCAPGRGDWDQCQTYGLGLYLPIHATIGWETDAYACRSSGTAGFLGEWDLLDKDFAFEQARASIAEIKANQDYWYGDYYPLTAWSLSPEVWMAYQFHRPDLDAGMVLAFRRAKSPYPALQVTLHGLNPLGQYVVTFSDELRDVTTKTLSGRELAALELRIEKARNSLLVRYGPAAGGGR
jgi:alpha-galactosidase